jgi:transcriptional regulator with XRE-family HTH domain
MTGQEFKAIRLALGLTQAQLAVVLGYGHAIRISEFERPNRALPVPKRVGEQMLAFAAGYRPKNWPNASQLTAFKRTA